MTEFSADSVLSSVLWIIIKASALVGLAALVQAMHRRRASAAARHFLWTLAIIGVLLLPLVSLVLPKWEVVVPTAEKTAVVVETRADTSVDRARQLAPQSMSGQYLLPRTPTSFPGRSRCSSPTPRASSSC